MLLCTLHANFNLFSFQLVFFFNVTKNPKIGTTELQRNAPFEHLFSYAHVSKGKPKPKPKLKEHTFYLGLGLGYLTNNRKHLSSNINHHYLNNKSVGWSTRIIVVRASSNGFLEKNYFWTLSKIVLGLTIFPSFLFWLESLQK